ncbi:MAG: hypothetical protein EPN70_06135 [Paraburkholderia sp.]|uniref:hypothetical protein n=1 Tax=Paraburkholderia sp. TaxID=1926495 RepID=UPI001213F538|nr:hypothetical protein [Paraburkholderia sp.]TAM06340.1 MAG: hypothetical protein EPN70_06135 [Paraburkholderia sp.]TAM30977.1 MAG: hypothetical protein EPN59_07485 [Paraburkholderia sp.]
MRRPLALAVLCASICTSSVQTVAAPQLNVTSSWIGNTYGYGDGAWTQINITAIAATPEGKVLTNAPWDESGAEISAYQDGKVLGFAGGTHGWGGSGGNAIAVNKRYLYAAVGVGNEKGHLVGIGIWPPKGHQWVGITRRPLDDPKHAAAFQSSPDPLNPHAQLAGAFLRINDVTTGGHADIGGLAASDSTLYVSNTAMNRIEVVDANTMQRQSQWDVREPGRIALAGDGSLWVLTGTLSDHAPRVAHYSAQGKLLAEDALVLPTDSIPVDIAVDPAQRILIADNGPRQQILIYARNGSGYTQSGTLGERGGIFSGVAGRPGPGRFNGLTGVATDARGNIYVSTNGIGPRHESIGAGLGATLESYTPAGKRNWIAEGLLFVDGAWMDPSRPNSVYTGNKRFELDLSKPAGQEWQYAGFLSNRFRYPDDPVFHTDQWPGLPTARALEGHTFLYLTDMYADHLKIYRFDAQHDGETAIPSGFIAGRERPVLHVPNAPPGGDWIWRDTNGNGAFDAGEFTRNTGREKLGGGWGWWIDTRGDIWRARDDKGIWRFRFGGLDAKGNPIYAYDKLDKYDVPAPFTEVHRAIYEPDSDSLYVTGYTADAPHDPGFWKEAGRVLVRYDHWSSGHPEQRYVLRLPWDPKAKPPVTPAGLTVEGQYVFVVEPAGNVHVYDKTSAKEIGAFGPGPEVGRASGWVDVPFGISAHRQPNGEYLVFVEEDARGKVLMYRWKPA